MRFTQENSDSSGTWRISHGLLLLGDLLFRTSHTSVVESFFFLLRIEKYCFFHFAAVLRSFSLNQTRANENSAAASLVCLQRRCEKLRVLCRFSLSGDSWGSTDDATRVLLPKVKIANFCLFACSPIGRVGSGIDIAQSSLLSVWSGYGLRLRICMVTPPFLGEFTDCHSVSGIGGSRMARNSTTKHMMIESVNSLAEERWLSPSHGMKILVSFFFFLHAKKGVTMCAVTEN